MFFTKVISQNKQAVGILCAGGPAPGINTVISAVAKAFLTADYRVVGINHGYKTIFAANPDTVDISYQFADRIFPQGGSALTMSRYKPKDDEFNTDFFVKNNIKLLVTIGGDDTASTANRISLFMERKKVDLKNIHVPKTIDNDLPLRDNLSTFGFQTAKHAGKKIAETYYVDAMTNNTWLIVSIMGRDAGHLAYGIGASCRYPLTVISEMFKDKNDINFENITNIFISSIIKRKLQGINYGCIAISEGIFNKITAEELIKYNVKFTYDEHKHPELGNIPKAHVLNDILTQKLKVLKIGAKTRPAEIGYEVRCVNPISFDTDYCQSLGNGVKRLFDEGKTNCVVTVDAHGNIAPLYLHEIEDPITHKIKTREVNTEAHDFIEYFNSMSFIREEDYTAASKYLKNPAEFDLKKILKIS